MSRPDRSIWWTRRAFALHAAIIVTVPGFAALFWWQIQRVRSGNDLSWAYVFEWPFFIGYAVYLWWKLVHEDAPATRTATAHEPRGADPTALASAPSVEEEEAEDEELAAYNRYLAELHAFGAKKTW